jgi:hypothetical protein
MSTYIAVVLAIYRRHMPTSATLGAGRWVPDDLLAIPGVAQVRTAYMEYSEPSIATQLKGL